MNPIESIDPSLSLLVSDDPSSQLRHFQSPRAPRRRDQSTQPASPQSPFSLLCSALLLSFSFIHRSIDPSVSTCLSVCLFIYLSLRLGGPGSLPKSAHRKVSLTSPTAAALHGRRHGALAGAGLGAAARSCSWLLVGSACARSLADREPLLARAASARADCEEKKISCPLMAPALLLAFTFSHSFIHSFIHLSLAAETYLPAWVGGS